MPRTLLFLAFTALAFAQPGRSGNQPFPAYHVVGNIYAVGADDIESFLITTPQGHIILNAGYEDTPPIIRDNVIKLGYKMEDVKIILNSHAHFDHVAGQAALQKLTGAKIYSSQRDAEVIETGGRADPRWGKEATYPEVKVDHIVKDGEEVKLGGTTMVAHLTPGHSVGCTTWTMRVADGNKTYDVVFVGGVTINPGVHFAGQPTYPGIAEDYAKSFQVLRTLKCDFFLGPHASYYGAKAKYDRMLKDANPNPFIDPAGYIALIDRSEKAFQDQYAREKAQAAVKR